MTPFNGCIVRSLIPLGNDTSNPSAETGGEGIVTGMNAGDGDESLLCEINVWLLMSLFRQ